MPISNPQTPKARKLKVCMCASKTSSLRQLFESGICNLGRRRRISESVYCGQLKNGFFLSRKLSNPAINANLCSRYDNSVPRNSFREHLCSRGATHVGLFSHGSSNSSIDSAKQSVIQSLRPACLPASPCSLLHTGKMGRQAKTGAAAAPSFWAACLLRQLSSR